MADVSADRQAITSPGRQSLTAAHLCRGLFGAALLAFAVVALATMETGLHGDPRTTVASPGAAPYPAFLGVTNWPLVTSVISAILTVAFFGYLAWRSFRARSPHWLLIVGIAAFFAGALDPLANWATFTVFDPRVAHFPLSWPYFNASPLLEPTLSFLGGYASYYVLTGLGLLSLHQRVIEPRIGLDKLTRSLPGLPNAAAMSTARLTAVATAVLMTAVLAPIAVLSLLRVGGDPKPAYDHWPFRMSRSTTPTDIWSGPVRQVRSTNSTFKPARRNDVRRSASRCGVVDGRHRIDRDPRHPSTAEPRPRRCVGALCGKGGQGRRGTRQR